MSAPPEPLRVLVIDDDKSCWPVGLLAESLEPPRTRLHRLRPAVRPVCRRSSMQEQFDVVLTDLRMADLGGLEIVKRCRHSCARMPRYSSSPVMAM